jgi:serpin B
MADYTPEEVNSYYQELTKALLEVDPNTSLSLANAIWVNKRFILKPLFVALNQSYYDAVVNTLDFSLPSTLKTINDWCHEKTEGTIPKILDNLDPSTLVILANAIYFNSFWTFDFDKSKTLEKPFYNMDGTVSRVSLMQQKPMELLYTQMEGCGMVTLPYANTAFAMNLILPDKGADINELTEELDKDTWQLMISHRKSAKVTLSMPRFKIENEWGLKDILAALGMPSAFSPADANFSAMLENDVPVYVSNVIQKSYISVDEAGTEAAAVTLIAMQGTVVGEPRPTPEEVTMVVDRPFIFAITEQSTGAILFMGKVAKL